MNPEMKFEHKDFYLANPVQVTIVTEFKSSGKKITIAYHQNYLTFSGAMLSLLLQGNNP